MDSRNHRGSKQQNPSEVEPAPRHVATQQQKAVSAPPPPSSSHQDFSALSVFLKSKHDVGEPQTVTHYPDHFEVNYAAGSAGAL